MALDPHLVTTSPARVRIDARHVTADTASLPRARVAAPTLGTFVLAAAEPCSDRRDWLSLHSDDLIDRLTAWSDDLARREANLEGRETELERRLRSFRLAHAEARRELDELREQLDATERSLDQRRQQIDRAARRIAVAEYC